MKAQANLTQEAINLGLFAKNFRNDKHVTFPRLISGSRSVLIETWEDGVSLRHYLNRRPTAQSKQIASIGLHAYLKMMLLDNFVHADLHPGNMLVKERPDGTVGLVFLDAGLVTVAGPEDWVHLKMLLKEIATGNGEEGAALMIKYAKDHQLKDQDRESFVKDMGQLFNNINKTALASVDAGAILGKILDLMRTHHVQIEGNFASLVVGTIVLEGIGKQLDPSLNLLEEAAPILLRREAQSRLASIYTLFAQLKRHLQLILVGD